MNEMNRDLCSEIVKAIETGINKYLDQSIKYTPFRLFYHMFRAANPNLMNNVRSHVRNDIYNRVTNINDFDPVVFIKNDVITPKGKQLLKISFNIGIHLFKKDLTVVSAFKVVTNANFRNHIYNHLLDVVTRSVSMVLHHN